MKTKRFIFISALLVSITSFASLEPCTLRLQPIPETKLKRDITTTVLNVAKSFPYSLTYAGEFYSSQTTAKYKFDRFSDWSHTNGPKDLALDFSIVSQNLESNGLAKPRWRKTGVAQLFGFKSGNVGQEISLKYQGYYTKAPKIVRMAVYSAHVIDNKGKRFRLEVRIYERNVSRNALARSSWKRTGTATVFMLPLDET